MLSDDGQPICLGQVTTRMAALHNRYSLIDISSRGVTNVIGHEVALGPGVTLAGCFFLTTDEVKVKPCQRTVASLVPHRNADTNGQIKFRK